MLTVGPHLRRSREKPVIKCKKMTFQYDGAPKPQLKDVTLKANMAARVGVLGPNGAGKSTLIKVITGVALPHRPDPMPSPLVSFADCLMAPAKRVVLSNSAVDTASRPSWLTSSTGRAARVFCFFFIPCRGSAT